MQPNLTWQLAKIRQTEALNEAAKRQAFRDTGDDRRQWPGSGRLASAIATSVLIVIPLVWILAAR